MLTKEPVASSQKSQSQIELHFQLLLDSLFLVLSTASSLERQVKAPALQERAVLLFLTTRLKKQFAHLQIDCSHLERSLQGKKQSRSLMDAVTVAELQVQQVWHRLQAKDTQKARLKVFSSCRILLKHCQKVSQLWPQVLHRLHKPSTVLVYLLNQRFLLDALYGSGFLQQELCKLFPQGRQAFLDSLVASTKDRHFEVLLPTIQRQIMELKSW